MDLVGAIDLGGTKILGGLFPCEDAAGASGPGPGTWQPVARERIDTLVECGPDDVIDRMVQLVRRLVDEAGSAVGPLRRDDPPRLIGLAVAAPGPLDSRSGVIIHAPNLFWHDIPLVARLNASLGVPVILDNDANLAGLAEWAARSGAPDPLLYVTVGTGVGGAIVSGGRILRGRRDAAGEIGHLTVFDHPQAMEPPAADGPAGWLPPRCNCGNYGCLETVASGTALLGRVALGLGRPASAAEIATLFAAGEPRVSRAVGEAARWLGVGLAAASALIDPEVIVLGGGVTSLGPAYLELVRSELAARLMPHTWAGVSRGPRLEPTCLGGDAGLVGAALAARRRIAEKGESW